MSKCRYCGREIDFETTAAGKMMPVEPGACYYVPYREGAVTFIDGFGKVQRGEIISYRNTAKVANYKAGRIVHFGRCNNAKM